MPEPDAHDHEGLAGVLPGRLLERGDAVGDGLHAGDGGAAGGERVEHAEDPGAVEEHVLRAADLDAVAVQVAGDVVEVAAGPLHDADDEQQEHVHDEEVGGDGEDLAALLHAPEVAEGDERDEEAGDRHLVRGHRLVGRHERGGAGGCRHGHGEDVVGEQRGAGHLGRDDAEVVPGDQVGATGRGVLLDRLPVGEDQEPEHHHHGDGDRHHEGERRQADQRDEDVEDLLGGVGARGEVVGGEHGERGGLAQPLVVDLVAVERRLRGACA